MGTDPAPAPAALSARLAAAVQPLLEPGELPLAGCFTVIGSSILKCCWLGPFTLAMFRDRKYLAVTSHRILILNSSAVNGKPTDLFASIPRAQAHLVRARPAPFINVLRLDVAGHILRLEVARRERAAFDRLAALLSAL